MHIFDLIFPEQVCLFPNLFSEQGQKNFLGRLLLVHISTVTSPGDLLKSRNGQGGRYPSSYMLVSNRGV